MYIPILDNSKTQQWHDIYASQYYDILASNNDIISAQFFGHIHSDEFRVIDIDLPPMLMCTSITPIFGTNPSFKIVSFDIENNGTILDYEIYNTELVTSSTSSSSPSWNKLYSFTDIYKVPDLTTNSLMNVLQKFSDYKNNDNVYFNYFLQFLHANYIPTTSTLDCDEKCHYQWICNLKSASTNDYQNCLQSLLLLHHPSLKTYATSILSSTNNITIIIICSIAFILFGCMICIIRFIRFKNFKRHQLSEFEEIDDIDIDAQII